MLEKFKSLFVKKKDAQDLLEEEVSFLRKQVESLQATIVNLTEKPKFTKSDPEVFRPKRFDPELKKYVTLTDEQIESERKALSDLGIL